MCEQVRPRELSGAVCQRVSVSDYEVGGEAESRQAIKQLLEHIVEDPKSTSSQKRKRLKKVSVLHTTVHV